MGLVHELQASVETADLLTLLRNARKVAISLGVADIDDWLRCEIDGYGPEDDIPDYRLVNCTLVGVPSSPVPIGGGRFQSGFIDLGLGSVEQRFAHPICSITGMLQAQQRGENIGFPLDDEPLANMIRGMIAPRYHNQISFHFRVDTGQLQHVTETVRNRVHAWTCDLQRRGIDVANASAQPMEKVAASNIVIHLHQPKIETLGSLITQAERIFLSNNSVSTGGGSLNVGGNFVQAHAITDSLNTAAATAANPDLVAKLKQLAETINSILVNVSPEAAKQLADDFSTFAKEATSKTPRPGMLTAIKDGMLVVLGVAWKAAVPVITPLLTEVIKAAVGS